MTWLRFGHDGYPIFRVHAWSAHELR